MTYLKAYFIALFRLLAISLVLFGFGVLLFDIPSEDYFLLLYIVVTAAVAGPVGIWIEKRENGQNS